MAATNQQLTDAVQKLEQDNIGMNKLITDMQEEINVFKQIQGVDNKTLFDNTSLLRSQLEETRTNLKDTIDPKLHDLEVTQNQVEQAMALLTPLNDKLEDVEKRLNDTLNGLHNRVNPILVADVVTVQATLASQLSLASRKMGEITTEMADLQKCY